MGTKLYIVVRSLKKSITFHLANGVTLEDRHGVNNCFSVQSIANILVFFPQSFSNGSGLAVLT